MTATLADQLVPTITKPGLYPDVDEAAYHQDPVVGGSLSSTGARRLLPPSCPAKFRYAADHPPEPSDEFDIGHAAHRLVLGVGPELHLIEHEKWNTNVAKKEVADTREAGAVPLKPQQYAQVNAMADALKSHKLAMKLLRSGKPEQTLVWQDKRTGVMLRARLDVLPDARPGKRLIVPDYKTAAKADDASMQKAIAEYGYHIQGHWYTDGVTELGLAPDEVWFVLVVQEKTPPYLVNVVSPTESSMFIGGEWAQHAIDIYKQCTETGIWPGYSQEITHLELPIWTERQFDAARESGLFEGAA
jgi:hypothetical protein